MKRIKEAGLLLAAIFEFTIDFFDFFFTDYTRY